MSRVIVLIAIVTVIGCQEAQKSEPQAPPPVVEESAPPPAAPVEDLAGFAPGEVLSVTFQGINEKGYPMVILKNLTGRDIETIRGSFRLEDAEGSILHSTGLTIAVPGQVFIAAEGETESSPYGLNRKEELMKRLAEAPEELTFSFEARDLTFLESAPDGSDG